jgi:hypothetical protein
MELAMRHGALRERIAAQRRELAGHAGPLKSALGTADVALAGVDWLKAHPEAVGVTVVVIVVASPKRAWRWARRAFFVWRSWQSVRISLCAAR